MKGFAITIPIGAVMAATGLVLAMSSRHRPPSLVDAVPVHPVTDDMAARALAQTGLVAQEFSYPDTDGEVFDLKQRLTKGPVMLIFVMNGCPCSIEAEPFFQRLQKTFATKIQFVGVIDTDLNGAKKWRAPFQTEFPFIGDKRTEVMRNFGAKESAYSALVGTDGRIIQEWPGFSQWLLNDMVKTLGVVAQDPNAKVDFSDAPIKATSGCAFPSS